MTISKLYSQGRVISVILSRAATLVLVASVLLSGCTGANSSTSAVVAQGVTNAALVTPGNAESAALADLHGAVEVKTGDGRWAMAKSGQTLTSGQTIRTGALSNVTLAFYDGSQMHLGAEANVALDVLDARTSGARVVQVTQLSGQSQHQVAQSDDPGSRYAVQTPAGNGSTAGATFTVMVFPDQLSQFWVEAGAVSVINENVTVGVVAGQTTSILTGEAPIEAEFRITGKGQLIQVGTAGDGSIVLPVPMPGASNQNDKITLCHATGSTTNPYVEITVSIAGATNGHTQHYGDIIPAPAGDCPISAPITPATPTSWNIAGQTYRAGAGMIVFGNSQPGDWVSFEGRLLADGTRFVDRIVTSSYSPENQFTFIGKLESVGDTTWVISSRVVQVNEFSAIETGLKVGDTVRLAGGIAEDGAFWAVRINQTEGAGSNFRFAGILTNIIKNNWVISGIQVTGDKNTMLYGDFVIGNPVAVEGNINADGAWLATTINLVTPEGYRFEFIGKVQSLSPWTVSSVSFDTTEWTEMEGDIKIGDQVNVSGVVTIEGIWVAERIELLNTENATSFAFFGPVLSINPWNVGGVLLTVDERTDIKGDITLSEMVKVKGWILEDGSWLATEIKHTGLHLGQGCSMVSSVVQSINGDQILLVDGQTIVLTEDIVVTGDLKPASLVRYQVCVNLEGQYEIVSITVVYQLEELPADKSVICHIPSGNPDNRHTIEVGQSAVPAHLAHGDTLGPCPSEKAGK